jgi:hypothetical protein
LVSIVSFAVRWFHFLASPKPPVEMSLSDLKIRRIRTKAIHSYLCLARAHSLLGPAPPTRRNTGFQFVLDCFPCFLR